MKYKVTVQSTNADHDTSQSERVEFIDAATLYYPHTYTRKVIASYYTNRFMDGKVKITLYDKEGKAWPREFVKDKSWSRRAYNVCVAHCREQGYTEEIQ